MDQLPFADGSDTEISEMEEDVLLASPGVQEELTVAGNTGGACPAASTPAKGKPICHLMTPKEEAAAGDTRGACPVASTPAERKLKCHLGCGPVSNIRVHVTKTHAPACFRPLERSSWRRARVQWRALTSLAAEGLGKGRTPEDLRCLLNAQHLMGDGTDVLPPDRKTRSAILMLTRVNWGKEAPASHDSSGYQSPVGSHTLALCDRSHRLFW
ncbi:uncharacterized protein [Antedon mediterranea]|uniref:uncharacterized protein n=1 Tax=Antedon mediterranea TaxID=105859 RepID=UPI003AF68E6D